MSFFRTGPGVVILLLLTVGVTAMAAVGYQVYRVTHPPRHDDNPIALASAVVPFEEVRFPSADGVELGGWILKGDRDLPFVILCHALGRSKASALDLGVLLQKEGFNLLLFDFRGHGASDGGVSTLGLAEKRDVIGAVDFVEGLEGYDTGKIGIYGVGMGAHAAVLAAVERPSIKVLVLDGLYPDPGFPLLREVYSGWSFGEKHLGFAPKAAFAVMQLTPVAEERAADVIGTLVGRDVLLLAPAGDSSLTGAMQAMYETIPEQRDSDGNLVLLPSTRSEALYGEDLELYERRVASFFGSRLFSP